MATPKQIELTNEEREALKHRIQQSNLDEDDKSIVLGLLDFNSWLQLQLLEKRVSIGRLRSMIFGQPLNCSTNPKKKDKPKSSNLSDDIDKDIADNSEPPDTESDSTEKQPKNKGKLAHHDYAPDETVHVKHEHYQAGQSCPLNCGGRLWNGTPGNVIKITGQGFARVTHYKIEKLRCALCGYYVSAVLPANVSPDKYDAAFKAQLCLMKYYLGLPFYRIEGYQKTLGIPLPDATQWDLVEQVADCVYPVFDYLTRLAAQGSLVYLDDTNVRILSNIRDNKSKHKKERRGTFTTGVISHIFGHKIHLYFCGRKHAGENMSELLAHRDQELPRVLYMCDALSRNIPKDFEIILINCLAHARRRFVEIESFFPEECQYVIEQFAVIYEVDAKAKQAKLSAKARLKLHQKHSKPVMDNLYQWLNRQLDENLVEANNSLGKAIKYMLKHWHPLTQFLCVEGAPLDNNILEQALKIPIRIRKNALFFKTEHGAYVGNMLLSLIQTCNAASINPFEYLTALQENKNQVFKEPKGWLPWNYKHQLAPQATLAA